jgi:hypothetical protein
MRPRKAFLLLTSASALFDLERLLKDGSRRDKDIEESCAGWDLMMDYGLFYRGYDLEWHDREAHHLMGVQEVR